MVPRGLAPGRIYHGNYVVDLGVSAMPSGARVLQSTGDYILDQAAINTLYQWRFRPRAVGKVYVPFTASR